MIAPSPTVPSPYADLLAAVPQEERSVEVFGSTTRYWVYGDAVDDGVSDGRDAAITLVAVHGFRGEHHGLEPVVAALLGDATAGGRTGPRIRIIAPDLPGFGESPAFVDREHSTASYAAWLRAFVAQLDLGGDIVVLGHSFGSIVSSAALAAGLEAAKLVLVNPIAAPALKGPRGIATRLAIFYFWLGSVLPEGAGLALLRNRVIVRLSTGSMIKSKSAPLRRWINDQHDVYFSRFATRQVVLEAFKASVSSDVSTYAGRITTPTLLVAADRDDITALPAQRRLQQLFPQATLSVVEGVGHLIHYEKPREAAAAIARFLA